MDSVSPIVPDDLGRDLLLKQPALQDWIENDPTGSAPDMMQNYRDQLQKRTLGHALQPDAWVQQLDVITADLNASVSLLNGLLALNPRMALERLAAENSRLSSFPSASSDEARQKNMKEVAAQRGKMQALSERIEPFHQASAKLCFTVTGILDQLQIMHRAQVRGGTSEGLAYEAGKAVELAQALRGETKQLYKAVTHMRGQRHINDLENHVLDVALEVLLPRIEGLTRLVERDAVKLPEQWPGTDKPGWPRLGQAFPVVPGKYAATTWEAEEVSRAVEAAKLENPDNPKVVSLFKR